MPERLSTETLEELIFKIELMLSDNPDRLFVTKEGN